MTGTQHQSTAGWIIRDLKAGILHSLGCSQVSHLCCTIKAILFLFTEVFAGVVAIDQRGPELRACDYIFVTFDSRLPTAQGIGQLGNVLANRAPDSIPETTIFMTSFIMFLDRGCVISDCPLALDTFDYDRVIVSMFGAAAYQYTIEVSAQRFALNKIAACI